MIQLRTRRRFASEKEHRMHRSRFVLPRFLVFFLAFGVAFGPSVLTATAQDEDTQWFVQEDFDTQMSQRDVDPEGPDGEPWVQMIEPEMVDTSEFATDPGWHVCFSNAGVNNPWRSVGYTTMEAEVDLHEDI